MKKNIDLYKKGVKQNIDNIKNILNDLGVSKRIPLSIYKEVLTKTVDQVAGKWESGRKYCRTHFIQKAFGKEYPQKLTELSLLIDAMVNILDDFFDEDLDRETKGQMLIEYSRVFSLFNYSCPNKKIQLSLGNYFNQLITLALAENLYQNRVLNSKDIDSIIEDSVELLLCRAMDIDVFTEIALMDFKNKKEVGNIKEAARIFRAINIFKKDIKDIDQDRKNNINTLILTVLDKKINLSKYSNSIVDKLTINIDSSVKDGKSKIILDNFKKMIKVEKNEIIKIV
jgi:hypothetical protein